MVSHASSLERDELGPTAIAEILPVVLARYALAETTGEDGTPNPPQYTVFSATVLESRG